MEIIWGRELLSRYRWIAEHSLRPESPLKGAGDNLVTTEGKKQGHQGLPRGLSTLVTQCLCSVQDQEPWNDGQGPKAAASLDKKSSTSITSAAESCSWPHKDAGNAGQKLYTGHAGLKRPFHHHSHCS